MAKRSVRCCTLQDDPFARSFGKKIKVLRVQANDRQNISVWTSSGISASHSSQVF